MGDCEGLSNGALKTRPFMFACRRVCVVQVFSRLNQTAV